MIIKNQFNLDYKETGHAEQSIVCPKCSQDRKKKNVRCLSVNIDKRVFKCHHCNWEGRLDGWKQEENWKMPDRTGWSNYSDKTAIFLKARGFSEQTIVENKIIEKKAFSVQLKRDVIFVGYPYFKMGCKDPVNVKWRCLEEKAFMQEKDAMPVMYNLQMWADLDTVIIVEGENDVMAFNEAGFWNCTTTNGGAINENDRNVDGKLAAFHNCYEYIQNKQTVYLATDNDGPGRRLAAELIARIGAERCKVISFPEGCKDANDTLLAHGAGKLHECFQGAKDVPVSGVFYLSDTMELMLDSFQAGIMEGERTHFGAFDQYFRWKKGQINLWTGYANLGKTTFVLQLALTKSIMDGWKWGIFSPENYPAADFYDDIIEMYVGKNVINTYGNKMSLDEYLAACDFINRHFYFIYPDEEHTIDKLHSLFAHLLIKHGIDGVLIDPYNQVEKVLASSRTDEEISEFMRNAKRFALKHNISYNIIAHPKLVPKLGDGSFPPADAYDVSGGAMWANKSDNIVSVHRPNWHKDKTDSTTTVHTQKIKRKRTGGMVGGIATYQYDFKSARYFEADSNGGRRYFCDPARKQAYLESQATESDIGSVDWDGKEEGPF